MKTIPTALPGVVIVEPRVFPDARGFFFESYNAQRYAQAGISADFVQDNHSCSIKNTVRGLHYQLRRPQGKLVRVIRGTVFDVAVDVRRGSPTFRKWVGVELSAENRLQLFVPTGYAHGFCVTSDVAELEYKCTDFYVPDDQHVVAWDDPAIGIEWPVKSPILSEGDGMGKPLAADRLDLPDFNRVVS